MEKQGITSKKCGCAIQYWTKSESQCRYFKMKAVGNHLSDKIDQLISESFEQKSILLSDKSTS
jgi:hypothetical protein